MAHGSIAATISEILRGGAVFDPRTPQADADPYRDRARAVDHRPETEGYLLDESDGWYVPEGNYLCRLVGEGRTDDPGGLSPGEIARSWFGDLRELLHDRYWHNQRLVFEPLERAVLDLVVVNGRLTRGELYRALVEVQDRDSGFRHSRSKTLSQNAHEAIGVPLYAQMVAIWT